MEKPGTAGEVFCAFLKLGLTSFGGPAAHLGYFRDEFVIRRKWISDHDHADLISLCQFLPGPTSSKLGFALGLMRAGPMGALSAWMGFTLPSAILLFAFAYGAYVFEGPVGAGFLHGLKVVAVAIIAQAVWGMSHTLTPDRQRIFIALAALLIALFLPGSSGQIIAIASGAVAGYWLCQQDSQREEPRNLHFPVSRMAGIICLALFTFLLISLPLLASITSFQAIALFSAFYSAGALVFGGGHVVLPLLQASVVSPGWVDQDTFIVGYGAAQAIPGPLFAFAAYLGAVVTPAPNGLAGAVISLFAIFLPGMLLLTGVLPFWSSFHNHASAASLMRGTNAAVVGILGAALYDPVWTSAILSPVDFVMALAGFAMLTLLKLPSWVVVAILGMAGAGTALILP